MEDVWRGITADRVPPGSATDHPAWISPEPRSEETESNRPTSLPQQLEWPCLINCKAGRGS